MFYIIVILFSINKISESKLIKNTDNTDKSENNEQNSKPKPVENVETLERIAVKSGQKIHVIIVSDILYLQAEGDYVQIFTNDGKYLKEQTMKYFENNLPSQFVRVHRSYIINIETISRIELYEKQNQQLTLKNGHKIKISIAGYKLLKLRLNL
jgi:DNA-binding LytR/AlgR family response regulator